MKLTHGLHLAYCTNIHRGEDWAETFDSLNSYTLAVRERVCSNQPYAIGLRLSDLASRELAEPKHCGVSKSGSRKTTPTFLP